MHIYTQSIFTGIDLTTMKYIILTMLFPLMVLSQPDQEFLQISNHCVNEIMENAIAAERCMDESIGTPLDVLYRLKSLVFSYNYSSDGDLANLIEFASHNCARLPQIMQCLQTTFIHTAECPRPNKQQDDIKKIFYSGIERVTNYICANNFDVIRKLIPNDGLRFLLLNDDFDKCFENVADQNIDRTGQICELIDIAAPCVLEIVGGHPNANENVVAAEIIEEFRRAANCLNLIIKHQ